MQSRYRDDLAPTDLLELRCYSSRLLGGEPSLVLHGGGNTSVKGTARDFFGDPVEVLWVKGSGWDLATIAPAGFAPVRLEALRRMADLESLSDADMVREQRANLLDPSAPDPSIEALVHAVLPHRFVDHTHADAIVTLTNTPDGEARVRALYGERVLVLPYVMPGFALARCVRLRTRDVDWAKLEGIVLMHHGLFTFGDDAKTSYERTIRLVDEAEQALQQAGAWTAPALAASPSRPDPRALAHIRREVSRVAGRAMLALCDASAEAQGFASRPDAADLASRGPVTPDHVIRTRRVAAIFDGRGPAEVASEYAQAYSEYFRRHARPEHVALDPAPRWAVWKGTGIIAFGESAKAAAQVADIARHSIRCFQWGEALGGWRPLGEREIFEVEYWELEQRKLRRNGGTRPRLAGKIALVTGGASGIGRAIAERLRAEGAAVCVLDRKAEVSERFRGIDALGIECDVTSTDAVREAVHACVRRFGGLDVLVSNAGDFPATTPIASMDDGLWERSIALNLTSHMKVMRACAPFLELGIDPAIVVVASRNVPAPGPGAAAYSVAKAGLTQLARVAALELAGAGVRVNVLHPDKVFDTDLWNEQTLAERARSYGLSVEAYRRRNLLGVEVEARDCAEAALALILMRATTGAQVPVDGGSERVV